MEEYERAILLERVEREGRVGDRVPATVDLAEPADAADVALPEGYGEPSSFALRDYVFDAKQGEAGGTDAVVTALRRRRTALVGRLEDDALSRDEGEVIVEEVRGIDRALNALRQPGGRAGLDEEAAQQELADRKRWTNFLKKVTGADDGDDRRRHGP